MASTTMASPEQGSRALLPVCILAGGLGTRLGEITRTVPKPLVEVAGAPFLDHQLRLLAHHGAREVVLCVGYLGEMIEEKIGAERFGISIRYSYDEPGLNGTLGAIRRAQPMLNERFLVLYGDTYLRIDYCAAQARWLESGLPAMMTVLRNEDRWDTSNVVFRDDRVVTYDKFERSAEMEWIDYGLGGLSTAALDRAPVEEPDLSSLQNRLAANGELFGYEATERFHEIGSPSALAEAEGFLRKEQERLENSRGADRG
jgi:NDP-sugar pyrophosphorylase family protein